MNIDKKAAISYSLSILAYILIAVPFIDLPWFTINIFMISLAIIPSLYVDIIVILLLSSAYFYKTILSSFNISFSFIILFGHFLMLGYSLSSGSVLIKAILIIVVIIMFYLAGKIEEIRS
ncbi:MAG: hypothetical protein JW737_01340 [Acidobacteria bacterium]|nr:hypothetical protein [Acidobacteriota bacterium]